MILPLRHEVWLNLLQRIGPHTHGLWRRWHRQAHSNKSCHFCWNLEQLNGICNKYKTTKSLLSNFIKMHVIIEEWLHPFDKIHILRMTDPPKYMIKSWWLKQLTIITQLENSATKVLHISQPCEDTMKNRISQENSHSDWLTKRGYLAWNWMWEKWYCMTCVDVSKFIYGNKNVALYSAQMSESEPLHNFELKFGFLERLKKLLTLWSTRNCRQKQETEKMLESTGEAEKKKTYSSRSHS